MAVLLSDLWVIHWRFYDCSSHLSTEVSLPPQLGRMATPVLKSSNTNSHICFNNAEPFFLVGLVFAILGGVLFILAFFRSRHSTHDFADRHKESYEIVQGLKTVGQENGRIFGRPFVTAGWVAVGVAVVVALAEIALLVLIIRYNIPVCPRSLWLL